MNNEEIKKEADGFGYVYNQVNDILKANFFGEETGKIVNEVDLVNPGITNGCFACELYLKAIILNQKRYTIISHNLKRLFYTINGKTQNIIVKKFEEKGYNKEMFKKRLKYIANGYRISRYDYESDGTYYMLSEFIKCFIEILKDTVENIA